ncbi:hypothetical protein BGM09_02095 [Streptomyces sp. CBMA29]|nr:hypothetical protein [Streptomyces sp. CBMA29]
MLAYLNESDRTVNDPPEPEGCKGLGSTTGWHELYGGLMATAEAVRIVARATADAPTTGEDVVGAPREHPGEHQGEHPGEWVPVGGSRGR